MRKSLVCLISILVILIVFLVFSNISIKPAFAVQDCTEYWSTVSRIPSCSNGLFNDNCTGSGATTGTACCQNIDKDLCEEQYNDSNATYSFRCCNNDPPPADYLTGWYCDGDFIYERWYSPSAGSSYGKYDCACGVHAVGDGDCGQGYDATKCKSKTPTDGYTEDAECYVPATPNCDGGETYGTCTGATTNTCNTGNGTQTCTYTTHSGGGACNQVACDSQACTYNNCSSGYSCRSGTCATCVYNRTFTQCGANAGDCDNVADAIPYSHTVSVAEYTYSPGGGVCRDDCTDSGIITDECGNTAATPWTTLSSDCSGSTPRLRAQWGNIGTGTCNIYIRAGSCDHQISTSCSGDMSAITNLGTCGTVANSTYYTLYADINSTNKSSDTTTTGSCSGGAKYKCSGSSCVRDDTNGTYADSNCGGACNISSGNTKTYVNPNPTDKGNTVTVTATGTTSCSTYINFQIGGGLSGCSDSGGACSGNPMGDGNSCWWRKTCSAATVGSFTASFDASGSNCYSSQNYTINNPIPKPNTPTIDQKPACIDPGYIGSGITISWTNNSTPVTYVDISNDSNFTSEPSAGKYFYNKGVSGSANAAASVTAPDKDPGAGQDLFAGAFGTTGTLSLQPSPTTYYVRTYNGSPINNGHSDPASFSIPLCVNLQGRVTDTSTGNGIGNVAINSGYPPVPECKIGTATTDANGNFTFNIPAGQDFCMRGPSTGITNYTLVSGGYECQIAGNAGNLPGCGITTPQPNNDAYNFQYTPPCPGGIGFCDTYPPTLGWTCSGDWSYRASSGYDAWCAANSARGKCYQCASSTTPWIQTTGDVHSNTGINAPGGP